MKASKFRASIFGKLLLAFIVILAVLTAAMHFLFQRVFFSRTYEQELQTHTASVAARVYDCMRIDGFYDAFLVKDLGVCAEPLRFLADYAALEYLDIWVVAGDTVMISYNAQKDVMEFDEIPTRYHPMVADIFSGSIVGNEQYKRVWNRNMYGVGTPVADENGTVIAAVIAQISEEHVQNAIRGADEALLLSVSMAAIAVIGLTALFASSWVSPLNKMQQAAFKWKNEDYTPRTGVTRRDEFGQLAASMDTLAERLLVQQERREEDERTKRQFFSDVSHELKTPVAVLRAQIEMLRDGIVADPDEEKECLSSALTEVEEMQRLIDDLLTLSKLQSPEFRLEMQPVCLCDVLKDIRRSYRSLAAERGVRFVVDGVDCCSDKDACTVMGDYTRIRQMIGILIDNAARYTPAGGSVEVRYSFDASPTVTVADNGCGMSEEVLAHVFERFYSHYNASGGSGLGLPIARQIALRHQAELTIESAPQKGTTAVIRFPAQHAAQP